MERHGNIWRFLLLAICLLPCWANARNVCSLKSPSAMLKGEIGVEGEVVNINLSDNEGKLLEVKTLQLELEENVLTGDWLVCNQERKSVNRSWQPLFGERSRVNDRYNELILSLQSEENGKRMKLFVRMYDEGMAFRYAFDELDFWNCTLNREKTQFLFDRDCTTWVTEGAQGIYSRTTLSGLKVNADRPQVVQASEHKFLAVGEAALVDYARMKLGKSDTGIGLQSVLSSVVKLDLARYQSPWRYVMVAGHPGQLVRHNDFILNLNEPCQIEDTSWIVPGQVLREVTLTTDGAIAAVDFAADNQIRYVEFDAGWYGVEWKEESDATRVSVDPARSKGPLDLHKIISYAQTKGVGIILYVNKLALRKQLDVLLPLYRKWGVKGIKFGFVDVGDQYSTSWLHQAVRKAARYEMMVDIHDNYRPTGYSRTYPNLITQEGIRGDEESPSLQQSVYTFYNRMICGAGDNTNCFFAERVSSKMGGRAAQLAKRVLLYSPWQFIFWYDRPGHAPSHTGSAGSSVSVIKKDAITDFYCSIPVVWDDTRFFEGEMDTYAVVGRRSASDWYVGVLNAGDKRRVRLPLDMLAQPSHYRAVLYYQPGRKKEAVRIKEVSLAGKDSLTIEVGGDSGCVLHLYKKH